MDVKLRFINHSNYQGTSHFVIFQKNIATDCDERAVVWR